MAKYPKVNISVADKAWLEARATANRRPMTEEISAIREKLEAYEQGLIRLPVVEFTGKGDEIGKVTHG